MGCLCSTTAGTEQPLKKHNNNNDESKLVMATLDTGWDLTDPSFETPQQIFARYESLMVQTRLGIVLDVLEASCFGPTGVAGVAGVASVASVASVAGVGATVAENVQMTSYDIERVLGKALVNIANCIIQQGRVGIRGRGDSTKPVTNMTKDALLLFVAPGYASCLNEQRFMVEQAFSTFGGANNNVGQLTAISQFFYDCAVVMTQILMLTDGVLMTSLFFESKTPKIDVSIWQQHDDAVTETQQQVIYPAVVAAHGAKGVAHGNGAKEEKRMRVVCRGMFG